MNNTKWLKAYEILNSTKQELESNDLPESLISAVTALMHTCLTEAKLMRDEKTRKEGRL